MSSEMFTRDRTRRWPEDTFSRLTELPTISMTSTLSSATKIGARRCALESASRLEGRQLPQSGDVENRVQTRYTTCPSVPPFRGSVRMKSQSRSTNRKRVAAEDALDLWREYKAT